MFAVAAGLPVRPGNTSAAESARRIARSDAVELPESTRMSSWTTRGRRSFRTGRLQAAVSNENSIGRVSDRAPARRRLRTHDVLPLR
jgi:hypothetical protein